MRSIPKMKRFATRLALWIYAGSCLLGEVLPLAGQNLLEYQAYFTGLSVNEGKKLWMKGNPATHALEEEGVAGACCLDPFLMKELRTEGVGALVKAPRGMAGITYLQQGFVMFRQQQAGISYATPLHRSVAIGVRLNYLHISLGEGYGKAGIPGSDIGILVKTGKCCWSGGYISFPVTGEVQLRSLFPAVTFWGIRWDVSSQVTLVAEAGKEVASSPVLRMEMDYHSGRNASLRTSVSILPLSFALGSGWKQDRFEMNLFVSYQSPLGFSPSCGICFSPMP